VVLELTFVSAPTANTETNVNSTTLAKRLDLYGVSAVSLALRLNRRLSIYMPRATAARRRLDDEEKRCLTP
jgi:hypothetical protein